MCVHFIVIIEIEIWGILGIQMVNPKYRESGYNYSEGSSLKVITLLLRFKSVSNPFQVPFLDRTQIDAKGRAGKVKRDISRKEEKKGNAPHPENIQNSIINAHIGKVL